MSRKVEAEYAEALDTLDRMRAAGRISEGQYAVKRSALMGELDKRRRPFIVKALIFAAFALLVFIVLRIVVAATM